MTATAPLTTAQWITRELAKAPAPTQEQIDMTRRILSAAKPQPERGAA